MRTTSNHRKSSKQSFLLRPQGHHTAAQAPSNMASPAHSLAEAKLKAARAAAAVAHAELKAAQATVALAQAELELAQVMQESHGGMSPSSLELPPVTVTTPLSKRGAPTACAPEPTSTSVNPTQAKVAAAPSQAAPRAGWASAATAGLRQAAASASGSVATAFGSASVSGSAGAFWDLGHGLRLRAWYICRGGGDWGKCNTFTLADGWGVNWSIPCTENAAEWTARPSTRLRSA